MNNIVRLLMLSVFISLQSYAQVKQEKTAEKDKIEKAKDRKGGMLFKLVYEHQDCSYEILVNDVPVITHYGLGERSGLTKDINPYILQAGKQEVTIRIFPSKKDETVFSPSLTANSFVKIEILKSDAGMSLLDIMNAKAKGQDYKWEVLRYQTPIVKDKPYAEYKTSFQVDPKDINWKITGWSKSQQLKNDADIRKEVDAFYEDFRKTLEEGDQLKYLSMLKTSIYEEATATPWDKGAEMKLTKGMAERMKDKRKFIYPCKQAELKFYGEGRVVTLVCADMQTFGYSPLISKSDKNMMPQAHTFYLHKPSGSGKLCIIR
ncbi:hypothetical protein [Pedobacter caeni]|uniref:DUF4412 domain-containing protein n=1 Tax=Pedobacter caeni TaxID=288992 RepID=A0A1M5KYK2_9SPHI|nr:hypothetical protein [Pedobacter caeni]SHG57841.1 hypothetical protein SAMN04488522_106142 [Pedobacter caeni]